MKERVAAMANASRYISERHSKIGYIKAYRNIVGCSLKEAKDWVETNWRW